MDYDLLPCVNLTGMNLPQVFWDATIFSKRYYRSTPSSIKLIGNVRNAKDTHCTHICTHSNSGVTCGQITLKMEIFIFQEIFAMCHTIYGV